MRFLIPVIFPQRVANNMRCNDSFIIYTEKSFSKLFSMLSDFPRNGIRKIYWIQHFTDSVSICIITKYRPQMISMFYISFIHFWKSISSHFSYQFSNQAKSNFKMKPNISTQRESALSFSHNHTHLLCYLKLRLNFDFQVKHDEAKW